MISDDTLLKIIEELQSDDEKQVVADAVCLFEDLMFSYGIQKFEYDNPVSGTILHFKIGKYDSKDEVVH